MVTVERDDEFLVFRRGGVDFYDIAIPSPEEVGRMMRHMMDKNWFADVHAETLQIIQSAHEDAA